MKTRLVIAACGCRARIVDGKRPVKSVRLPTSMECDVTFCSGHGPHNAGTAWWLGLATAANEPTLSEVLAGLGWSSRGAVDGEPVYTNGKRLVLDVDGAEVGWMTAGDTWELLRERGLLGKEAA